MKQQNFEKTNWKHRYSHGGSLRQKRAGRKARPLSTREPIHLVFKANRECIRGGFRSSKRFALIHRILRKYAKRFWIKVEQVSIQHDHIHFVIRSPRRAQFGDFFRVFAGQVAQQFEKEGLLSVAAKNRENKKVTDTPSRPIKASKALLRLWKHRPFTRVVIGWKAYQLVRDYVQLNEKEVTGQIRYQKARLRGLCMGDWEVLWNHLG
jgi:REP element-mobilizing transposase RayT